MTKSIDDNKIISEDHNVQRAKMNKINLISLTKNGLEMDSLESLGHEVDQNELDVIRARVQYGKMMLKRKLNDKW